MAFNEPLLTAIVSILRICSSSSPFSKSKLASNRQKEKRERTEKGRGREVRACYWNAEKNMALSCSYIIDYSIINTLLLSIHLSMQYEVLLRNWNWKMTSTCVLEREIDQILPPCHRWPTKKSEEVRRKEGRRRENNAVMKSTWTIQY